SQSVQQRRPEGIGGDTGEEGGLGTEPGHGQRGVVGPAAEAGHQCRQTPVVDGASRNQVDEGLSTHHNHTGSLRSPDDHSPDPAATPPSNRSDSVRKASASDAPVRAPSTPVWIPSISSPAISAISVACTSRNTPSSTPMVMKPRIRSAAAWEFFSYTVRAGGKPAMSRMNRVEARFSCSDTPAR